MQDSALLEYKNTYGRPTSIKVTALELVSSFAACLFIPPPFFASLFLKNVTPFYF